MRPAILALFATALPAQVAWSSSPIYQQIPTLNGYGLCHHEQTGKTVLFGGFGANGQPINETWEWDGAAWSLRAMPNSPQANYEQSMVYDSLRQVIVLLDATLRPWEYDGTTWTPRPSTGTPPLRSFYGLAFDRARGRTVLFGGQTASYQHLNDTWEWDGLAWSQPTPALSPAVRKGAAMAFDPVRQRVMLYGGGESYPWPSQGTDYQDHWEWDGTAWTLRAATTPMGTLQAYRLQTHSGLGRVLLFTLATWNAANSPHWEWNGTAWVQATSPTGTGRFSATAYDPQRNRIVAFGSYVLRSLANIPGMTGVWEWDATNWQRIGSGQPPRPVPRYGHGFAYLPSTQTCVLFGGSDAGLYTDTWEWNGTTWTERQPAVSPPGRYTTHMATHASRNEIVLFGGQGLGGAGLGDTWVWNGTTWSQRTPAFAPPARYGHGMAGDTLRDRVVLFGGTVGFSTTNTTYEWDGTNWTLRTLPASPPARTEANLAFDSSRGRTVLFGGASRSDTWEYNGTTWVAGPPGPPQGWPMLAYDAARQRTVLFGNSGQAWEWDGIAWQQRVTSPAPPGRSNGGLAYDAARRRLVLVSGINAGTKDDLWEYGPTVPALWTPFANGCPGSMGTPSLEALSLPWLGTTCTLRIGPVPAGQFALLVVGSRVAWGAVPLPLPLAPYGMPGCTLSAGGDLRFLQPTGTFADAPLPLPNLAAALGVTFDVQAAVSDPGTNPGNLVLTPAATMTLGGR
ncbi:MAG: hypothetical protein JNK49_11425 [Planctomycetes bacterium]|nr:hypothetical protein [Planctomycetota bacterium]